MEWLPTLLQGPSWWLGFVIAGLVGPALFALLRWLAVKILASVSSRVRKRRKKQLAVIENRAAWLARDGTLLLAFHSNLLEMTMYCFVTLAVPFFMILLINTAPVDPPDALPLVIKLFFLSGLVLSLLSAVVAGLLLLTLTREQKVWRKARRLYVSTLPKYPVVNHDPFPPRSDKRSVGSSAP